MNQFPKLSPVLLKRNILIVWLPLSSIGIVTCDAACKSDDQGFNSFNPPAVTATLTKSLSADCMASTVQELVGLKAALDDLYERIETWREYLLKISRGQYTLNI